MEDSSTTSETLALYRELRNGGHDNVGVVLQAALKRTLTDIGALADLPPNVRVCKGIYVEPAEIAYQEDETMRLELPRRRSRRSSTPGRTSGSPPTTTG